MTAAQVLDGLVDEIELYGLDIGAQADVESVGGGHVFVVTIYNCPAQYAHKLHTLVVRTLVRAFPHVPRSVVITS